jgi:hypothetical protein
MTPLAPVAFQPCRCNLSLSSDDKEDSVEEGLRSRRAPRSIEVDGRDVVGASERGLADTPGESV